MFYLTNDIAPHVILKDLSQTKEMLFKKLTKAIAIVDSKVITGWSKKMILL